MADVSRSDHSLASHQKGTFAKLLSYAKPLVLVDFYWLALIKRNRISYFFSCVRGKRKLMADVRGQFGIDKANKAKEDQKVLVD